MKSTELALFNFPLFNPTLTFLRVIFSRFDFLDMNVCLWPTFLLPQRPYDVFLCFLMRPLQRVPFFIFTYLSSAQSLLYFIRMASFYQRYLVGTPSLSASYTISGCLSSSPIPLILSEAFLSPLQFTLTHFSLSSYERALRLPTIYSILGLDRFGVIPSDFIFSYRDLASIRPLMLYPSPSEVFSDYLPIPI